MATIVSHVVLHPKFTIAESDPKLFGGFIEHLGRAVYEGIYEPTHPTADEQGFRGDVLELIRELDMPVTRYPGGNFVSNYKWEDGVGPVEDRPTRLDLAWQALEPNEIGTNEFMDWAKKANTEVIMAVNLGTREPADAANLLEYCNFPGGTEYSDLRKKHGWDEPHGVKYWCLGNEMDGPWQMGHCTATQYGQKARDAATMMRYFDKNIKLILCGSCTPTMSTFGTWDSEVLEETIDIVDYLSLHRYYSNHRNEAAGFLAQGTDMDACIERIVATCDAVAARKKIDKKIMISLDEWNVWTTTPEKCESPEWTVARALLEDCYSAEDALVVGDILISMLNHADRVKIGCLAQSVNVIAPVMTRAGGGCWKQTIFHPFHLASKFGRGMVLQPAVESPTYDAPFGGAEMKDVPYLSCAAVQTADGGVNIFVMNRSIDSSMELTVDVSAFGETSVVEFLEVHHDDLKAVNTETETAVEPQARQDATIENGTLKANLTHASWNLIRLTTKA